jgi:5'-nucleotidase
MGFKWSLVQIQSPRFNFLLRSAFSRDRGQEAHAEPFLGRAPEAGPQGGLLLVLVSNDDGVGSEGVSVLKESLSPKHEVYVVAPERERTCTSHAVTIHKPLRIREIGPGVFSTNGTPADCILLAVKAVLPRIPDVVVSGINKGPNMGQDVNYSGTVAAAKEGAFLGIPSLAVSLCARKGFLFHTGAIIVGQIIDLLEGHALVDPPCLNVNVPNIPLDTIRGFEVTRLGKRIYNDTVVVRTDPRGGEYYWIAGDGDQYAPLPGTDFYAIEKGYVSVTPLSLDATNSGSIDNYETLFRR